MAKTIDEIVEAGLCHGCGACAAVTGEAFRMELTHTGYLRPKAQRAIKRQEHDAAMQVCSGAAVEHARETENYHPLWGPLVDIRTGFATDAEIRYAGSSGGVISAVALHLIESEQIDYVLHVGADPLDPFGTLTRASRDRSDIIGATGSRYAPSAPLAKIGAHLETGARFAVIGKPCDIASLRRIAKHDPRVNKQIPAMIAFMCAGVPSREGTLAIIEALGSQSEEVLEFHYRGQGWPGFARARLKDGRELRMDYNSSWGTILNKHLQFRCKICPDGTGEFADMVCADAWYGSNGYPDFVERDGRSMVLTRTARGEALVQSAIRAGVIEVSPLDVDEIAAMQPYQTHRKRSILSRLMAVFVAGQRVPRYRNLGLLRLAISAGAGFNARAFAGMLKRASVARRSRRRIRNNEQT